MKYVKNIGAIVLVASFCSFAGIDLRIGGGLNISDETYYGDYTLPPNVKKSMYVGFNVGAGVGVYILNHMGITGALSFETRGSKEDFDGVATVTALNYLQVPVHFSFRPVPLLPLAVGIGPELGIFINGKSKIGSDSQDFNGIKPIDFGASVSVDYTLLNMVAVGAGYYFGFLNNNDASAAIEKNSNIKIYVAYVFHL
jgi:hypothetical protein